MSDHGRFVRVVRLAFVASLALQTYLLYFFSASDGDISAPTNTDKLVHMAMFGGPALLALIGRWRWVPIVLAVYAPMSEVLQGTAWVGRDMDWRDAVADVSGIIAVVGLWVFLRRR